jgi:hypothetical protein
MQINDIQKTFSFQLAFFSFVIGTLFLIIHLIFPKNENILFCGFMYTVFAVCFNQLFFFILLLQLFFNWKERESIFFQMLILAINIPIAVLYIFIVFN